MNLLTLKNYFQNIDSKLIESLTILDSEHYQVIASRMNVLVEKIIQYDNSWLVSRINEFLSGGKTQTKENFSGLLGEIRAYGELLDIFEKKDIVSQKDGSDFILELDEMKINIEINTPQKTSSPKKTTEYKENLKTNSVEDKVIIKSITSSAPFGYPTKKYYNIQYEAVSKFAGIKKEKENKQFTKENPSILWLDMNDPTLFIFDLAEECQSIKAFNGAISSGALWYAFYGEKDDWIYASYDGMCSRDAIQMEFDGRFKQGSNIDFVVIDAFTKKYIFQNPYSEKEIPKDLYKYFLNLFGIQLYSSYFDFDKCRLRETIENTRNKNNQFFENIKE